MQITRVKMLFLVTILGFFFVGLAQAANSIIFTNNCAYDAWFWTVGPPPPGDKENLYKGEDWEGRVVQGNGGTTVHALVDTEELGGGMALKIRDLPKYRVAPAGIVQLEYHLEPTKNYLWYDLSLIDCNRSVGPDSPLFCPLVGGGINLTVSGLPDRHCPPAWCKNGQCFNTYEKAGPFAGEPSYSCNHGADVSVEFCKPPPSYTLQ
jgi:hypothetical protein